MADFDRNYKKVIDTNTERSPAAGFPASAYVKGYGCVLSAVVFCGIAWYTAYRTVRWFLLP